MMYSMYCLLVLWAAGETGSLKLDNPKNNFERNATDKFAIRAEDVGALQRMKIWSDDKGPGSAWHLDVVTVVSRWGPGLVLMPCSLCVCVLHLDTSAYELDL